MSKFLWNVLKISGDQMPQMPSPPWLCAWSVLWKLKTSSMCFFAFEMLILTSLLTCLFCRFSRFRETIPSKRRWSEARERQATKAGCRSLWLKGKPRQNSPLCLLANRFFINVVGKGITRGKGGHNAPGAKNSQKC